MNTKIPINNKVDLSIWARSGSLKDYIASTRISKYESYVSPTQNLFQTEITERSGIIISGKRGISGDTIEDSCYSSGSLRFIYKSYDKTKVDKSFPTEDLVKLIQRVSEMYLRDVVCMRSISVYVDSCWAVCQRDGDYGTVHNHMPPDSVKNKRYSGMFYLQAPNTINPKTFPNGCLHIITDEEVVYYPPIPGSIILWPSHLLHGVHPFRGIGDRLGIAFNINIKEES